MQHAWRYPAGIVLGLLLCGSCRAAARETAPADAAAMPPASQVGIMLAHKNEVEGIDAMLLATARPLDPPAHWQPPRPASASTLQTRH